jgi:hypothetical protein
MYMKTNIRICTALMSIGLCIWSTQAFGQTTTTTVTTSRGAFTEYVPGSHTVVVRGETGPNPLRYSVTKQTTIVDEAGAPLTLERIPVGAPLSVQYTGTGDHLIASRIVVSRPVTTTTTAPVTTTTAPVTTTTTNAVAPVTTQESTTTTSTTRPLTHREKHAVKEEIERRKDALEDAKDKLDDDD